MAAGTEAEAVEDEEQRVLRLEFNWLLAEEIPSVFDQLKAIIQTSIKKFKSGAGIPGAAHIAKGNNFLLSLPNSDAVKGLINISGDSVIKAELRFKFPKLSSSGIGSFIFEQCPWKLPQLQDASNHLEMALDEIKEQEYCGNSTCGKQVMELMNKIMSSLGRAKACLIVPEKKPLSEVMCINAQKVLNPPVPEELLISFHVNCDKLVLSVYVLNILTAPASQKSIQLDHASVGYAFESNGKWFEVINKVEIICTVPWLKDLIVWINTAQQICQQLNDKINIFQTMLPDLRAKYL